MSRSSFLDRLPHAASVLFAVTLSACSANADKDADAEAPPSVSASGDGRSDAAEAGQSTPSAATATIAQYPAATGTAGMDALLKGKVQIAGRCVYVAEGEGRTLPVFPQGSAVWQADGIAFRFGGRLYADGDDISLGGGAAAGGAELAQTFFSTPLPSECETDEMWIVSP